jgi:hypothetical protein
MSPSEFVDAFGQARIRVLEVPFGVDIILPPDRNRAVLSILSTSGPFFFTPFDGGDVPTQMIQFNGGDIPLTFTHALHASIVNLGWLFTDGGGPVSVTIAEVFMKQVKRKETIPNVNTKVCAVHSARR